jgi:SAM-dependent methyltransferase
VPSDFQLGAADGRTMDQIRRHYEIEKELAARLRTAPKAERSNLYREVYNELYRRVPDHPMLTRKVTAEESRAFVRRKLQLLSRFLSTDMTVLEIGCGDCHLSFELARRVRHVYGVEVSEVIAETMDVPGNFELVISDGTSIPVPDSSVDLAFSDQLMEHLHPDDAAEQLANIARALRPGGVYVCKTPHRLQGPGDISQYFDDVATGLHLKEYDYAELAGLFRGAGLARTTAYVDKSGTYIRVPVALMSSFDSLSSMLFGRRSYQRRQAWLRRRPFTVYLQGIAFVGWKGNS